MDDFVWRWQRQLVREHEHLCWYHGLKLPTPLFEISDGRGLAGSWQAEPAPGVLRLAGWLIQEHGWEVVLEVLKHEMSHQYVDQVLGGDKQPHGPVFREACRRLGVHPSFRCGRGEIPRLLAAGTIPGRARGGTKPPILGRVEKLLALAGSANEHEAARAMEKAGELMRRHNLERLARAPAPGSPGSPGSPDSPDSPDSMGSSGPGGPGRPGGTATCDWSMPEGAEDYDFLVINSGLQRRPTHHRHLGALLQDFFYVKTVSYQLYDPHREQQHRVLELLGRRENLAVAEHVYHFLEERLPKLWRHHRVATGAAGREKNSYYLGVLNGLRKKLQQGEKDATSGLNAHRREIGQPPPDPATRPGHGDQPGQTCSSLVCAGDRDLQEFMSQRYPRLRNTRGRGTRLYRDSYQAGEDEGRRLVIHRAIHQQQGNRGRLIGG